MKEIKQFWKLLGLGNTCNTCYYWQYLSCYPKPSKSQLIMKEEHLDRAKFIFKGREVKITKSGQRAAIAIWSSDCK